MLSKGILHSHIGGNVPVALGGGGDAVGSYDDVRFIFLALNVQWKP